MNKSKKDKNKNGVDDRLDVITNICSVVLPLTTLDQLYIIYIKNKLPGFPPLLGLCMDYLVFHYFFIV